MVPGDQYHGVLWLLGSLLHTATALALQIAELGFSEATAVRLCLGAWMLTNSVNSSDAKVL